MASELDPVARYARMVLNGTEVASHLVKLACERHLRDLEQGSERGLVWNPDEAQDACDFFPEVLCLPEETESEDMDEDDVPPSTEARPFILSPFQQFIVGSLFGWQAWHTSKKTGKQRLQTRFRVGYVEIGKGAGKTPLGAGILIYMLIRKRNAQLFCAAVGKDQAKIAFADCVKMVNASPYLRDMVDQKVNNLSVLETGSFIRPISSEKRGLDGKRVQGAVIDELHEHIDEVVVGKVRAGIKGRPDALVFIPTNSGFDRESICWQYHEVSRQVLQGAIRNDSWFAFVCHLDACEKCRKDGHLQPVDDCDRCDDWKVEGPHWLKANPNLGVSVTWQYLREQVQEALNLPSVRNLVRRLNFCQWTQAREAWIAPEQWAMCRGTISSASLVKRECYIGIDLSDQIDLSSVVAIFPRPLERPDVAPRADAVIDRAIDVLPLFWMPKDTIARRSNEDNVDYLEWSEDDQVLRATPGSLIDHDEIVEYIINTLNAKYHIKGIGFDQSGSSGVATRLIKHFGEDIVTVVPQGFKHLSHPSKTMEALIISRNVAHDGNPVMAMCMANMAKEENRWKEIRPVKISQRKRIDGGVALIDAIWAMQHANAKPEPQFQCEVYGGRT